MKKKAKKKNFLDKVSPKEKKFLAIVFLTLVIFSIFVLFKYVKYTKLQNRGFVTEVLHDAEDFVRYFSRPDHFVMTMPFKPLVIKKEKYYPRFKATTEIYAYSSFFEDTQIIVTAERLIDENNSSLANINIEEEVWVFDKKYGKENKVLENLWHYKTYPMKEYKYVLEDKTIHGFILHTGNYRYDFFFSYLSEKAPDPRFIPTIMNTFDFRWQLK